MSAHAQRQRPFVGHLPFLKKRLQNTLARLAACHGPVFSFRLGSCHIAVVTSAEATRECFSSYLDVRLANRPRIAGKPTAGPQLSSGRRPLSSLFVIKMVAHPSAVSPSMPPAPHISLSRPATPPPSHTQLLELLRMTEPWRPPGKPIHGGR